MSKWEEFLLETLGSQEAVERFRQWALSGLDLFTASFPSASEDCNNGGLPCTK